MTSVPWSRTPSMKAEASAGDDTRISRETATVGTFR